MKRLLLALAVATLLHAANADLLTRRWKARWISVEGASPQEFGVYHFRKSFDLPLKPERFVVHVTGDNRYQLYVNGARVVWGPARGDLAHWRYESIDIAPELRAGANVLAAVVWNDGQHRAVAQISNETGFLLQGDSEAGQVANSGASWRAIEDKAYLQHPIGPGQRTGYHALAATEEFHAADYPWGWEQPGYDDSGWKPARAATAGEPRYSQDGGNRWMLVPRPIPLMEESPERLRSVRKAEGVRAPAEFLSGSAPLAVPANTLARLILDQEHLTTAFPEMIVSGGRGARIALKYAEGLWLAGKGEKGDRNEIEGKRFLGYEDVYLADGGAKRFYRPLFWRTYRYIELTVQTAAEPLTIDDLRGVYTGYPFLRKAKFDGGPAELQRMLEVGWRTARLCSHETYMDCPYYEQLQYAGDTRLQGLVSIYMTGDGRLLRNAIEQLNSSRTAEGATYSRAPSALQQYIPGFSLWWIGMLHDYWMYVDDPEFVREMLPGVRSVLSFFEARRKPDGLLGHLPWWPYVDWTKQWPGGVPPSAGEHSAPNDLQLTLAYGWASEMEAALGNHALGEQDREAARALRETVRRVYWDEARGLFSDTPRHAEFSQQTNALAVLAGVVNGQQARSVLDKAVANPSLVEASIYFRAYLNGAMREAGFGDRYLDSLGQWRKMLDLHLTTWAESLAFDRSDCHAWGASPNFELFRTVLGVDSMAPGFRKVRVAPQLGKLEQVSGVVPHPRGEIRVSLKRSGSVLEAEVELPAGVDGEFVWQGVAKPLASGRSRLRW